MIVDTAVDHADQRRVVTKRVQRWRIGQSQIEGFSRGHVWRRRQIDGRNFLNRQERANELAGQTCPEHADRGANVAIEDVTRPRFDVPDHFLDLTLAQAAFAEIPKLDIDQVGRSRDETL